MSDELPQSTTSRMDRLEAKIDSVIERLPEPAPRAGPTAGMHSWINWLDRMWVTRLLASLGIWLFFATVVGLYYETQVRGEEREARAEEAEFRKLAQIATAWELLLTRAGGDIGKGNALNTLIAAGQPIVNADFSCEAVGISRDGECVTPPQFTGVNIGEGDFWEDDDWHKNTSSFVRASRLDNVNFKSSIVRDFKAEYLEFNLGLEDVAGSNWTVRNAVPRFYRRAKGGEYVLPPADSMEGFYCENCEFYNSRIPFEIFKQLGNPGLIGTVVSIPQSDQSPELGAFLSGAWGGFVYAWTTIDNPVVFEFASPNASPLQVSRDFEMEIEDVIVWRFYEDLDYCLTQTQTRQLALKWREILVRDGDIETGQMDMDRALHVSDVVDIIEGVSDYPEQLRYRTHDQAKVPADQIESRAFNCDFRFKQVEPLLRPQLLLQAQAAMSPEIVIMEMEFSRGANVGPHKTR